MKDELLTIQQAAKILGVSTKTLRRWEAKGHIKPARTIGNQRRYSKEELATVLKKENGNIKPVTTVNQTATVIESPLLAQEVYSQNQQKEQRIENSPIEKLPIYVALSLKPLPRVLLAGVVTALILCIGLVTLLSDNRQVGLNGVGMLTSPGHNHQANNAKNKQVLGASDAASNFLLTVNIPGMFSKPVTFLDTVTMQKGLSVAGVSQLSGGVTTSNADITAGSGKVTASNLLYGIVAGSNISISGNKQNPTISATVTSGVNSINGTSGAVSLSQGSGISLNGLTISNSGVLSVGGTTGAVTLGAGGGISVSGTTITNTDLGSSQDIFKNFTIGGDTITAGSNSDTINFAAGSGISLTGDTGSKTITITSNSSGTLSGLTTNGVLYATTATNATSTNPGITGTVLHGITNGAPVFSSVDLTSDVANILPLANGGTGIGTINPTNGEILIGNGSGYSLATVTQGTGIGVANGSGSITLSNTGVTSVVAGSGIGVSGSTGAVTLTNSGVLSLTGTANEVNLTGGTGAITVSLPQSIANTSTPTFTALSLTSNSNELTLGNGNTGTITLAALGGSRTYTLPDISGTICISGGTCAITGGIGGAGTADYLARYTDSSDVGNSDIYDNGKVGIGTTSPQGLFYVSGGEAGQALVGLNNTAIDQNILVGSASGTTRFVFDSNGDLNIIGGDYEIGGANVLSATTLGTTVLSSSLTGVGALSSGSIATGFGTIQTSNTIQGTDIISTGATGLTVSGNGAGLTFSGTGNHSINASGGTLELGAVTLTGDITGNSKNVTGVNNLAAGGTVTFSGFSTNNGLLYTSGTGLVEQTAAGSIGQCLEGNGAAAPIWATCAEGLNYWQMPNSGAIAPFSTTADLLVGGTSSTSAEFAFTGVDTNTPIASISAQSGSAPNGLSLNGATDMIQSLNDNTLTIGGNTTGNVLIAPGNMPVMTALSNNTIDFGTNTDLYLSGSNAFISNPQGQTGSEAFGANANVYGNYAVSVGNTAESEGSGVAVGANAEGYSDSVAIGSSANGGAGGSYGVSVGYETVSASYGIAIGAYAGADASDSIALGVGSVASSSNQIVIGSSFSNGGYINNAYIGSGISDTSPQGITIHATGASAGQTNLAGASLTLAGGLATGNAAGGSLLFQTSVAGTSGTSQQSLVTRMVIDNNGNVGVGITNPSNTFAVQSSPSTQNAIVNMYGSTCVSCYDYGVLEVTSAGGAIAAGQERPLLLQPAGQTYGTVGIGVGSIDPLATLDVRGNSNSTSVATISGNTSSSAFVVDNSGSGALFSANNTGLNRFTILQNGNVGIGTTTPAAPLQINGAYGNNAALIVNQLNNGDLIDASQGGILKFAISNGGAITTGSYTASIIGSAYGGTGADLHLQTVGAIPYFSGTGVMGGLAAGSIGQCLEGDGAAAPIWATCAGGQNYWQLNSGAIAPFSTTADLLLGGTSTTSAMFAFINNGGTGIPTASISANSGNNATYLTGAGVLGTTNMQSLTVGSSSTGNVSIAPGGTTSGINVTSSGKITMSTSPSVPFGNPAVGTAGGSDFGLLTAQDFTTSAGGGGTVSSMSVYIHSAVGASHLGQLAIYSDSSGTPGSYIASSAVTTLTGNSWNTMPVSATLSPSTTYWLVFWSNDSAGSEEALVHPSLSGYFDFSDVGWQCSSGCSGGTTNGFPNSFPTPLSFHDDTYDASIYVTYTTTSGPAMTIDPSGNIVQLGYNTELSFQGTNSYISNTQDYTNSEAFGLNASVNGVDAATLGEQSLAQAEGEAIGYSADAGTGAVAIGEGTSNANGTGGGYGEAIGLGASSATNGIAIGQDANDANDLSIAMGYAATTTATNQLVIGSSYNSGYGMYINSGYFGSGVTDTSPQSFTLNATGGSGSNINGANLFLAGGKGTGNATGGVISFETSIAGTSGSTLQTLEERMRIDNNGNIGIGSNFSTFPALATLDLRGNSGIYPVASISGNTAFANLIVDQSGSGDLFSASKSGTPIFTITNAGGIALFGSQGSNNQCITSNGVGQAVSWGSCGGIGTNNNYWQLNSGALAPYSTTLDLLLGGTATTSAKFAFTGVDTTSPVASIAANPASGTSNGLTFAGATDTIQSLNRNTLTIGGNTTGDIALQAGGTNPDLYLASNGNIGVGTTTPVTSLDIEPPTNQGIALGTNSYPSWMGTAGIYLQGQIYALGGYIVGNNQAINWGQSTTQVYGVSNNNTSDYLYFGTNSLERLRINGFGELGFNTTSPLALFDIRGNGVGGSNALNGTIAVASFSGQTSFANTIVDQSGSGDIFTASKSGATKFTILNNGNIQLNNYTTAGGVFYGTNTGTLQLSAAGTSGQCLVSQGAVAPSWASCGPTGLWNQSSGALYEGNTTEDLLLGGTATTSAKFAFTGVDTTSPVASISANPGLGTANGLSLTGATDAIQSLNRNTLTIGGNTTGDISFQPGTQAAGGSLYLASNGNVGIGTTTPLTDAIAAGATNATGEEIVNTSASGGHPAVLALSSIGNGGAAILFGANETGADEYTGLDGASIGFNYTLASGLNFGVNGISNNNLIINPGGFVGINNTVTSGVSGTGNDSLVVNQPNSGGDIFSASQSGNTKFLITNTGNVSIESGGLNIGGTAQLSNGLLINTYNQNQIALDTQGVGWGYISNPLDGTWALAYNKTNSAQTTSTSVLSWNNNGAVGIDNTIPGNSSLAINQPNSSGDIFSASQSGNTKFVINNIGNVGIGTTTTAAPLQVTGAYGNNAALIVNNINSGDLIDASQGGALKFAISNGGAITTGSYTAAIIGSAYGGTGADLHLQTIGAIPYFSGTGVMGGLAAGSIGQCLEGNGAASPIWATCAGGLNYWQMPNPGAIAPFSTTADLLLGGTATTSAKFAFTGVDTATPVASISANPGSGTGYGLSFAGATSAIQSLNRNTLTIGGNTTGDISFQPGTQAAGGSLYLASNGNVGIGTAAPGSPLTISANPPNVSNGSIVNIFGNYTSTTNNQAGIYVDPTYISGVASSQTYIGGYFVPGSNSNNVNTAKLVGVAGSNDFYGAGDTLGTEEGGYFQNQLTANGTVSNSYGVYIDNPNVTAGTITSNYGLYINSQTTGTTNYALYTVGNASSYFGGNVGIGTNAIGNGELTVYQPNSSGNIFSASSSAATTGFVITNSGNVGIGTKTPLYPLEISSSPSANLNGADLQIDGQMTSTTIGQSGINVYANVNPAFASTQSYNGGYFELDGVSSGTRLQNAYLDAIVAQPTYSGTGTLGVAVGSYNQVFAYSGTINNAIGEQILSPYTNSGAGTIGNDAGLMIDQQVGSLTAGGDINEILGTLNFPSVSSNYSIYNVSPYQNYFDGNLGIGTTAIGNTPLVVNQPNNAGNIFSASSSGTTDFVISNSGNVGIGTSSPNAPLQIGNDVYSATPTYALLSDYSSNANGNGSVVGNWVTGGLWGIGSATDNTDDTLRIGNINGSGSSPTNTWSNTQNIRLKINGTPGNSAQAALNVGVANATLPVASFAGQTNFASLVVDNSGTGDIITASSSGQSRFTVQQNGNILLGQNGSTSPVPVTIAGAAYSGSNTIGSNLIIAGSTGTGGADGGNIVFQTATASAGIAEDTYGGQNTATGSATLIWNHTTGSENNKILVVGITSYGNSKHVNTITYGAQTLTKLKAVTSSGTYGTDNELWYLINPTTGSHNVYVTLSGSSSMLSGGSATYYNVSQSTPFGNVAATSGNSSSNTINFSNTVLNTNTSQMLVNYLGALDDSLQSAVGGGQEDASYYYTNAWYSEGSPYNMQSESSFAQAASGSTTDYENAYGCNCGTPGVEYGLIDTVLNPATSSTADTLSNAMVISPNGQIGIGTSSPSAQLSIQQTQNTYNNLKQFGLSVSAPNDTDTLYLGESANDQGGFGIYSNYGLDIGGYTQFDCGNGCGSNIYTNFDYTNSYQYFSGSGQNFEIEDALDITKSGAPPGGAGDNGLALGYDTGNYGWMQSYGNEPLEINPLGNSVNIGSSATNSPLTVYGSDGTLISLEPGSEGVGDTAMIAMDGRAEFGYNATNTAVQIDDNNAEKQIEFWTGNGTSDLERMQIDADDGNVGIGTSSPQEALSVAGNIEAGSGDNGTPVASYIRGADASGTDISGANLTLDASDGTGIGGSGNLTFSTAPSMVPQLEYQNYDDDSSFSSSSQNDSWGINLINNHNDQVLIVTEYDSGSLGNNTTMTDCPTSAAPCGAGGLSFTKINSVQDPSSGGEVVMWYLKAPYPNISYIQPKLTATAYTSTDIAEYYNVNQTTPIATSTTNSGTGTSVSKTLSSTAVGELVIDALGTYNGHNDTPGSGQAQIWNDQYLYGSSKPAAGSSTTMSWTISSSDNYGQVLAALNSDSTTSTANTLLPAMTILPNGNVGIGTATPSARLTIVSNASSAETSENYNDQNILDLTSLGVNNASLYMGVDAPSDTGFIQVSQTGLVDFLSLNPRGGSVGIGVTQAQTTLQVNGTISGNEHDRPTDTNPGTTVITDSTAGYLSYFMHANKTSGNNAATTTYNLTGLPSVAGALAYVTLEASQTSAIGSSAEQCVSLEINGVNMEFHNGSVCDTTDAVSSEFVSLSFIYTDGAWQALTAAEGYGNTSSTDDLAEWISTTDSEPPPEGSLISLGNDVTSHESSSEYDNDVGGVVSTNPNTVYGTQTASSAAMTLAGRVPAIVTSLGGNIDLGDPIVSSPIVGAGMVPQKAGESVGQAMQTFDPSTQVCTPVSSYDAITWPADDGTNPSDPCFAVPVSSFDQAIQAQLETEYNLSASDNVYVGKIMVLVGKSYTPGMAQLSADGNITGLGQTGNNNSSNPISSSSASFTNTTSGSDVTVGNLTANSINTQDLTLAGQSVNAQLNSLENSASSEGQLSSQVNTLSNSLNSLSARVASDEATLNLLASGSALLNENPENFTASSASELNLDQLTANNAVIDNSLSVLGTTTVADLGVTGNISVGLLSIDGLDTSDGSGNAFASLNTSSGPLKIQSFGFNGVDFENGQLTIDPSGNLITQGSVTAGIVNTNKLNITQGSPSTQQGVLSSSAGSITIPAGQKTIDIQTSALTSKSLIFVTPDQPVEIGAKATNSDTFRITLNQAQSTDLHVNWWIVN